jgi:hypothetical protein
MRPGQDEQTLRRWLEADTLGRHDDADRLFAGLAASHWAKLEAPRGLAAKVVTALASARRPAWWEVWWVRAVLAASLASVGGAFALVPSPVLASAGVSVLVGWAQVLGWLIACSGAAVDAAWFLWSLGASVSSWVGVVLSAPLPQLLLVLNLVLAVAASAALRRLLRPEEIRS